MPVNNTSTQNNPLISIVTVTYNAAPFIEETLKSIINYPDKNFEYIVIDGNSTDGTQKIVEKYFAGINVWLTEPDNGIPDALNKGVKLAKGKYVLFILAGDKLIDLPYMQIAAEDADVVCFPVKVTANIICYPKVNNWLKIKNTIPHQGAFFKRTPNLIHDNRYRFFCDFALCQIYYINNLSFKVYNEPIVAFHGLDGATSEKKNFHEVFEIIKQNYGITYKALSYVYWKHHGLLNKLNPAKK